MLQFRNWGAAAAREQQVAAAQGLGTVAAQAQQVAATQEQVTAASQKQQRTRGRN